MTTTPATAVPGSSPAASGGQAGSPTNGILGQNDFLKLMIAQLQAQNPLEPGNTNEFLNELAQITQVEQITNLATSNQLSSAVNLIGHNVSYTANGELKTGVVQSAQSTAGGVTVTVAGEPGINLQAITQVE